MSAANSLQLGIVALEDIPAITELWYTAFTDPGMRHLFPDTSSVRQWWDDANRHDLLHKPFQKYLKVVDPELVDKDGRSKLVAYAKWDMAVDFQQRGSRFPPWHAEMPGQDCDAFFTGLDRGRARIMGDKNHIYLDMLATHPDYRRRGAASLLVGWGCKIADQRGLEAYVDASKDGAPLYEKFGFVDRSDPTATIEGVTSMVRSLE
ncbi:hypothetical protein N7510_001081 [Penicillium lagena]|uniref:uncharacterized protein n=1 Tax=Penicillium lagena TaxID=94218 RepID=UPI0025402677|nr:uncharacterized protein N7510_001081 [Penicillium lagena]KAJ5624772.1 hypothetical protein N7510_001081 [Penicillium lagena]